MHVVYVLDRKDILLFDLNHLTDLLVESDYPVLQQRTTCKETNYCKKGPMIRNMGYNATAKKKSCSSRRISLNLIFCALACGC